MVQGPGGISSLIQEKSAYSMPRLSNSLGFPRLREVCQGSAKPDKTRRATPQVSVSQKTDGSFTCSPQKQDKGAVRSLGTPWPPRDQGVKMTRLMWPHMTPGKLAPRASMSDTFLPLHTPPHRGRKRLSQHTAPSVESEGLNKASLKEGKLLPLLWTLDPPALCVHISVCAHLLCVVCVYRHLLLVCSQRHQNTHFQSPPAQTHPQVLRSSKGSQVGNRVSSPLTLVGVCDTHLHTRTHTHTHMNSCTHSKIQRFSQNPITCTGTHPLPGTSPILQKTLHGPPTLSCLYATPLCGGGVGRAVWCMRN